MKLSENKNTTVTFEDFCDVPDSIYDSTSYVKNNKRSLEYRLFNKIKKVKPKATVLSKLEFGDINKIVPYNSNDADVFYNYETSYFQYVFQRLHNKFPGFITINTVNINKFVYWFCNDEHPQTSYRIEINDNKDTIDEYVDKIYAVFGKQNDILLTNCGDSIYIIYDKDKYKLNETNNLTILCGLFKHFKSIKRHQKNKIYIICRTNYGFDKIPFDIKKQKINIEENYNDDFLEISKDIVCNLNDKRKCGLFIFNGPPGCGKTTFLRYIASKINNKDIIFIPPDLVDGITDPSFIPFLLNNKNSILIIEDAEPALQKRGSGGRSGSISNVLNLTDGLLSDCVNISIVCTFNTNLSNLDDALLRKGRLTNSYKFEKLCPIKSAALLKKLGHNIEVKDAMSLSDIYNYSTSNNIEKFIKGNSSKIGF